MRRLTILPLVVTLAAACGGNGDANGDGAAPPPPPAATGGGAVTVTVPEDTARPEPTPTGNPTFSVELEVAGDTARPGRPWRYTVRAVGGDGKPTGGTAKMRVFVEGELVDTLGFFAFDGTLTRTHVWPRSLSGENVVFQAEVEGDGGTQRVNRPVRITG